VLFLALPHLSVDLGANANQQLWITDIYGFMIAGFLVTMGTLGDRIGRRRVLLTGAAGFCIASVLAASAGSPETLIAARVLLGIAAATVMPSVLALITNMFPDPKQMGTAIGIWASAIMAGVVLGPPIGGLMLAHFWWGSVFLLGVPVMLLLLVTGPALIPEYRDPNAGRIDLASVVLSLAALLPIVYGLKELARTGWGQVPFTAILAGLAFAVAFVSRQRRLEDPLLDLRLFGNRALSAGLTLSLLIGAIMAGTGLMAALYMQMVEGLTPLQAGMWLLVPSLLMIGGANLAPLIARRVRPAYVLVVGMVIAVVGMVVLTQVSSTAGLATLMTGLVIVYIGGSPVGVLVSHMIMTSAPPERAGAASSLSSTGGELGVALGVATLGSLSAVVYRGQLTVPADTPRPAAASARESIASAVATARDLPGAMGTDLLESARAAFTSGLHAVTGVTALLFLGLAIITAAWLRHVPPTGEVPEAEHHDAVHG
jgi:DHA2 family multidrug resistance protein-like MFS transporter